MRMQVLLLIACAAMLAPVGAHAQDAPKITVIPVKAIDAADAVKILEQVYHEFPGLTAEALPKLKCVAVRADAKTTREIRELLQKLDEATAESRREPGPTRIEDIDPILISPGRYGNLVLHNLLRIQKNPQAFILGGAAATEAFVHNGFFGGGHFQSSVAPVKFGDPIGIPGGGRPKDKPDEKQPKLEIPGVVIWSGSHYVETIRAMRAMRHAPLVIAGSAAGSAYVNDAPLSFGSFAPGAFGTPMRGFGVSPFGNFGPSVPFMPIAPRWFRLSQPHVQVIGGLAIISGAAAPSGGTSGPTPSPSGFPSDGRLNPKR